ncbi:uncharacterized protein LOC122535863 isoform X2 [Frieseomelitta varia]|uniref:uncharacterized protein LOC122535863 isoform X2 n=1 Tax=Frieseomelitta varia TaxID=561572 RepID=UPI001CB69D50|nr:uncharacterized protein LOC122535863 isoform X2 [Frieseomelitta varia]
MKNRMSNASQQFVDFFSQVACWTWETLEKLLDIILDFLARIIELILAVMNLIFQVICFLRDLCIEAMQTFANVFRGIVNVVRNISCEEVEDFASACIVILLWIVAFKLVRNLFQMKEEIQRDFRTLNMIDEIPRHICSGIWRRTVAQKPELPNSCAP